MNFRTYLLLALIAAVPIWSGHYFPTVDGPSHLYNSWLLQQLLRGNHLVAQWYAIDWRPNPNWSGHVVLALLISILPPPIAEKIFVTGIVLLFAVAMWMYTGLADETARPFAIIALPFAYNRMLQAGFYNFSIGVALYFLVVAVWWRRRDRPDIGTLTIIGALLLLCYFSHPLPAILAILSIAILWIVTLPRRRAVAHARHLAALIPASLLLLWFVHERGVTTAPPHRGLMDLLLYLERMGSIVTLQESQETFGTALFVTIVALIVLTFIRRQRRWSESDGFILVTLLLLFLCARAPDASSGGTVIIERIALFVALSPLAWISPRLSRPAAIAFVVVASVMSLVYTGYLFREYRILSRGVNELVRSAEALGHETTFIPLTRTDWTQTSALSPVLRHAIDFAALEKHDVDLLNYEARTGYFPTKVRSGVYLPGIIDLGHGAMNADLTQYLSHSEYVFTWQFMAWAPVFSRLEGRYDLVSGAGGTRVYRRRH